MDLNGMNQGKKNGKRASEHTIDVRLGEKVRRMGCLYYKFTCPGHAGVPDRIIITPTGHVVFVELKTDVGHPSPAQLYHLNAMLLHGVDARIIYGTNDADSLALEIASIISGGPRHGV